MLKQLLRIRISVISVLLFIFFVILLTFLNPIKMTAGQLALFSVNSFLFGYYFAPLLASQKIRVSSLIVLARQEETTILDILTQSHLLTKPTRHKLKVKLRVYLESIIGNKELTADNIYYDELLRFSKQDKGEDAQTMNLVYDRIAKTLTNRDSMNNLFASKIYSHEWLVASVLFGFTLFFALQTDYGHKFMFGVMLAILCTGLSLLMVIVIKFATLTHKEAKRMWVPLTGLLANHFEDITNEEVEMEKSRIDKEASALV